MKKFLKILFFALLGLLAVALVAAFVNRDRLVRLYNVVGLFKQERIVDNFSSMDAMFLTRPLARSGPVTPLPEALGELPQTYTYLNERRSTQDFLEKTATTSLLVLSDGKIFFEEYYLGTGPADRRISWSVAKSFLSALFGVALDEGQISSLEDPVTKYVPALSGSAYDGVPIAHVLTMSSGVVFDEDYLAFNSDINRMGRVLALGMSMDDFAAGITQRFAPSGTQHKYVSIDTHVLAMVLRAATGKSLPQLFEEKLWSRIGAQSDAYYVTDGFGVAFALGGLNITTRDYGRFGLLFANGGRMNGEQIISPDWVEASTSPRAPAPAGVGNRFDYGYQWWVPVSTQDEFFAVGIYGQYIYVNASKGVVIVKTSADRNFRNDGQGGLNIKHETIAMFRAIAARASASGS